MSEIVERVKLAVYATLAGTAQLEPAFVSPIDERGRGTLIDGVFDLSILARAAIAAMREPTEAIVSTGLHSIEFDVGIDDGLGPRTMQQGYVAMIDEALK